MKKNIILLLTDDQRFDTIHALGNGGIETPHLDWLVENGTSFEQAFIPGGTSGAVCMPSRAMINSGKFLTELEHQGETIPETHSLLGETLREEGFDTWGIGKWHNGTQSYARSFTNGDDIFFGGMWDHWNVPVNQFSPEGHYDDWKTFSESAFSTNKTISMPANKITLGKHSTDLFADDAVAAIQTLSKKENPFYMSVNFLAPHDPRTMPEVFKNKYHKETIPLPDNYLPSHPFDFDIQGERDETLEAYPRLPDAITQHMADYYGMITHIDARVGDIIQSLKDEDLLEDTLIVFTSDNGLAIGQHGLMGKQNLYDCSIHVPLVFCGPNIPKNHRVEEPVLLMDLYPTFLDYIQSTAKVTLTGKSMLPLIYGTGTGRDSIYLMFTTKIRGVMTRTHKLLEYVTPTGLETQLFDRLSDPTEKNNLAHALGNKELIKSLRQEMYRLSEETGDREFNQGKIYWSDYQKYM